MGMYMRISILRNAQVFCSALLMLNVAAQRALAEADCDAVYQTATRDLVIDNEDRSTLFTLYDNYCDSKGSTSKTSAGIGLDVVIKAIPISFTGNYGNSSEAVSNFCRNYQRVRYSNDNRQITRNTVVVEALKNYNDCKKIISQGVNISHAVVGLGDVIISFEKKDAVTQFEVQSVSLGPNITCSSTSLFLDSKWHAVDEKTHAVVKGNASIACKRAAIGTTEKVYPKSWIGVSTNVGAYSISLLPDSIIGGETASNLGAEIGSLKSKNEADEEKIVSQQAQLKALQESIEKIKAGTKFSTFKFWTGEYGGTTPEYGDRYDPRDNPDALVIGRKYCPAPAIINVQQVRVTGGGCCGYAWYTGTCVSYQ
jgi:hypothetical protein